MLCLLGNRAVPMSNLFDSDAAYNTDECMYLSVNICNLPAYLTSFSNWMWQVHLSLSVDGANALSTIWGIFY